MNSIPFLSSAALAVVLAACTSLNQKQPQGSGQMWVSEAIRTASIHNAITAQRCLYPYHFFDGAPELNELGLRDLGVLAEHIHAHPGVIHVRRGACPDSLYQGRLRTVTDKLVALGVVREQVRLDDGMPGGDGTPATRVLRILEAEKPQVGGQAGTSQDQGARNQ